jgi:hypothetical protein
MPLTIRKAETAEDRQRVFRFRYEIYVEEMRRPQRHADHQARTIEEPFDATGHIFLAEDETGRVAGTVRANFGRDTDFGYYHELYGMDCVGRSFPEHVSITTKLMVRPELRSGTLAFRIGSECYRHNLRAGILFDFIDCNPYMEGHFQRLGYRRYRDRIQHPEYGDVLPLVLPMTDLEHLESVGAPLARFCREHCLEHCPQHAANHHLKLAINDYLTQQQAQAA